MRNLTQIPIAPPGGFQGFGPLGLEGRNAASAGGIFSNFLSLAVGIMTIVAGIWFVFVLITGAVGVMTAGGDKAKVEDAKKRIANGLIGLVVVIASLFVVGLIGQLLGLPYILNPALFIFNASP